MGWYGIVLPAGRACLWVAKRPQGRRGITHLIRRAVLGWVVMSFQRKGRACGGGKAALRKIPGNLQSLECIFT